jgi:hypothetical protein
MHSHALREEEALTAAVAEILPKQLKAPGIVAEPLRTVSPFIDIPDPPTILRVTEAVLPKVVNPFTLHALPKTDEGFIEAISQLKSE